MENALSLYEYRDLLMGSRSVATTQLTFYVSLITAYLVVAYFVGRRLNRIQLVVLSAIYSLAALGALASLMDTLSRSIYWHNEMAEAYPDHVYIEPPPDNGGWFITAIFLSGFLMSLVFMWLVRRQQIS